jgi:hypothetical protein
MKNRFRLTPVVILIALLALCSMTPIAAGSMASSQKPGQSTSPDFTLTAQDPSISVPQGEIGQSWVNVGSVNGFNAQVSLSVGCAPGGCYRGCPPVVMFWLSGGGGSVAVTPPPDGNAIAGFVVSVPTQTESFSFAWRFQVTGVSDEITHQTEFQVFVLPANVTHATVTETVSLITWSTSYAQLSTTSTILYTQSFTTTSTAYWTSTIPATGTAFLTTITTRTYSAATTVTQATTVLANLWGELGVGLLALGALATMLVPRIRSFRASPVVCRHCGFMNPRFAKSFCVRCGEALETRKS